MNNLDKQYTDLLQDILDNGVKKGDRTGTGTLSVFGRQIKHKMSEGFPLLTTKKMYTKGIITELLWFLRGETNIKYLVDNDCHIWDGDAYRNYTQTKVVGDTHVSPRGHYTHETKEEFINKIKTDDEFAKKWGELGPVYGKQWRRWEGIPKTRNWNNERKIKTDANGDYFIRVDIIDQFTNLINKLKTNPDDRRMMVTAWNPAEVDNCVLPPCHYGFQVWTRELNRLERIQLGLKAGWEPKGFIENFVHVDLDGWNIPTRAISLMWNQRSCDFPLGIPYNIASYGILLSLIANIVNMIPEELIGNLGDCHIYSNQIDGCTEQIIREPYQLPTLLINTEFWPTESGECGIGPLTSDIDTLINNMEITDFQVTNYKSHPTIKFPLSN
jgi:thymidylate synthase